MSNITPVEIGKGATPGRSSLHVDRYLTNWSMAWVQDEANFVGNRASSIIPVTKQSDKYLEILRGSMWRDNVEPRPLFGRPNMVAYDTTSGQYLAEEYGLETGVDDRQRSNTDAPLRQDENATRLLTQQHLIRKDRFWAENFFTTGKWTTERTGVASGPTSSQFVQFDQSNSSPIDLIEEYKDHIHMRTGYMPNVLVASYDVRRVLRTHAEIQGVLGANETKVATDAKLAGLFGLDAFVVPRGTYNSANEGQSDSLGYIAGTKRMWLGYIDPNATVDSPTAVATFAWTGLFGGIGNAVGGVLFRARDDRAHTDIFQMGMAWDMKIVAQDLGVFFGDVIS